MAGTNSPISGERRAARRSSTAILALKCLRAVAAARRPATLSAEDQQQVADDRAGQRRLDDLDQAGLQGEERDDQLGDVAERRVEDAADLRAR